MKGVLSKAQTAQQETSVAPSNHNELTALMTFLITEIKDSLAAKIDLLCTKIDRQQTDIEKLYTENIELRQVIKSHEKTISELKEKSTQAIATTTLPNVKNVQNIGPQYSQNTEKQRGIKAFNLIFTCEIEEEEDPKSFIEQTLLTKFNRKPLIQTVNVITTRGQRQPNDNTGATSQQLPNDNTGATSQTTKIMVCFHSIWDAKAIYRERMKLKNSNIYISEDLTRNESHLFYLSRMLKKNKYIYSTWTENGDTYFKETEFSPPQLLQENNPLLIKLHKKEKDNSTILNIAQTHEEEKYHIPITSTSDSTINVRNKKVKTPEENVNLKRLKKLKKTDLENNGSH